MTEIVFASGFGAVGRGMASDGRGPQFKSNPGQLQNIF